MVESITWNSPEKGVDKQNGRHYIITLIISADLLYRHITDLLYRYLYIKDKFDEHQVDTGYVSQLTIAHR